MPRYPWPPRRGVGRLRPRPRLAYSGDSSPRKPGPGIVRGAIRGWARAACFPERSQFAHKPSGAKGFTRSHGLRGNAVLDAPRPQLVGARTTRSVEECIPTGDRGNEWEALGRGFPERSQFGRKRPGGWGRSGADAPVPSASAPGRRHPPPQPPLACSGDSSQSKPGPGIVRGAIRGVGARRVFPRTKPIRSEVKWCQGLYSFPRSPWECRRGRSASAIARGPNDAERRRVHSHGGPWERVGSARTWFPRTKPIRPETLGWLGQGAERMPRYPVPPRRGVGGLRPSHPLHTAEILLRGSQGQASISRSSLRKPAVFAAGEFVRIRVDGQW